MKSLNKTYRKLTRPVLKNQDSHQGCFKVATRAIPGASYKLATVRGITFAFVILCLVLSLVLQTNPAKAQSFTRTITKKAAFANQSNPENKFIIKNINGSVSIEAYNGNTIELTVNEKISGSSDEIEKGKKELSYKLEHDGNLIFAYPNAPYITISRDGDDIDFRMRLYSDKHDYRFTDNVTVRVPRGILVDGSTVNKGKLTIDGSFKKVEASNVNGALELHHMTSETHASTVNGDITINYDRAPDNDSEYHTINGTINLNIPDDLSADVYFQSMHGDLYTNFNNIKRLKPEVLKQSHTNSGRITYQVDKTTPIRIGQGGPKLQFEVLNGDVYIRKQS